MPAYHKLLTLKSITPENYERAMQLSVREDQKRFVASLQKSLADAYVYQESVFRIAYSETGPVGYLLVYPYVKSDRPHANIVRLMIDQDHQRQGFGRSLLRESLNLIASFDPKVEVVRISTDPENLPALTLYKSEGFIEHEMEEGEVALYLSLNDEPD